jgi:integrase
MKRHKTTYPGVFYREVDRIGGNGRERVYYIVFKKNGKVFEEKVGRQYADDMTPARAARIRAERIENRRKSPKEIRAEKATTKWTVGRLWQEYIHDKPATHSWRQDRYRYENYLKATFCAKEPKQISQIDAHRQRLNLGKHLKPQTVKHILVLLQRLILFGVKRGLCQGLSFQIEMPKVNNLKTEDLSPEQLSALIEAINEDHDILAANFMKIVLVTGMRRGELFKLQWDDIDFDRGFIHIRHDPKGGKDQTIPMNLAARNLLENHPRFNNSPFVFPGRGGRQRTDISWPVNRIKTRAGLPKDFRPLHGLRHVYASMLASSGEVDLYTLQKLLTHKTSAMTQRYAHLRDDALRRASDLAGELLNQAVNCDGAKVVNRNE